MISIGLVFILLTQEFLVTLPSKRIVQFSTPTLSRAPPAQWSISIFVIVDDLELVVIVRIVPQTFPSLDMEVDAKSQAEDDDQRQGRVNPDLGASGSTESGEERRQKAS